MSDERGGLPSASSASRYAACLGSYDLERQVAEVESSGDAAIGNRIHAALALETVNDLTTDETWIIERCQQQELELVKQVLGDFPKEPQVFREKRLWSLQNYGLGQEIKRLWSGKPDVVYIEDNRALIIDYKSGRGSVENAAENLQLRCLVALLHESFGFTLEEITVAIVQPLAGPPSVASYKLGDLMDAVRESQSLMSAVMQPDQPRTPSESACKYCKGKTYCPEARELAVTPPLTNVPVGTTPDAIASTLTNQTLAEFLNRAAQAEAVIEACRSEARRRLGEGDAIEGWTLKDGSVRESITDSEKVASRFLELGTYEQLAPAITLNKTKLKEAIKTAIGLKGQQLTNKLDALLDGCTESKTSQPTLTRTK
jgi:hypothetical protein